MFVVAYKWPFQWRTNPLPLTLNSISPVAVFFFSPCYRFPIEVDVSTGPPRVFSGHFLMCSYRILPLILTPEHRPPRMPWYCPLLSPEHPPIEHTFFRVSASLSTFLNSVGFFHGLELFVWILTLTLLPAKGYSCDLGEDQYFLHNKISHSLCGGQESPP